MKKVLFGAFLGSFVFLIACKSDSGQSDPTVGADGEEITEYEEITGVAAVFEMDRNESVINWKATKVGGGHNGLVRVNFGRMAVADSKVLAGEATVDMASLEVLGEDADTKSKLEGHLKSADFFDVEKFPFAQFSFEQIQPQDGSDGFNYTIRGGLRIKDVTKSVTIPCNISISKDKLVVKSPPFAINRTEWGVNYGSGILGTVADKIINDEIVLQLDIICYPRDPQ